MAVPGRRAEAVLDLVLASLTAFYRPATGRRGIFPHALHSPFYGYPQNHVYYGPFVSNFPSIIPEKMPSFILPPKRVFLILFAENSSVTDTSAQLSA